MTTANKITMVRLMFVPAIIIMACIPGWLDETEYVYAKVNMAHLVLGVSFAVAALTDFIDGYWARKFNQTTEFGKVLDQVVDKILMVPVLFLFASRGDLPFWVPTIMVMRELIISAVKSIGSADGTFLKPSYLGKFKATLQFLMVISLFLLRGVSYGEEIQITLISLALLFTIISALDYIIKNRKIIFKDM